MKYNLINIIWLLFLPLFIESCDNIPDPSFTLLRVPLSQDFTILADSAGGPSDSAVFSLVKEFDPVDNADFSSNRSKLAELDVEKMEYLVKQIGAGTSDSLIGAKFEFFNQELQQFQILAEDANRKLKAGDIVPVNLNSSSKVSLIKILTSPSPKFQIRMTGKMDKRPINLIIAPQILLSLKTKL